MNAAGKGEGNPMSKLLDGRVSQKKNIHSVLFIMLASTSAGMGGCMIPTYKEPAGFSSSYFRRLDPPGRVVLDTPPLQLHAGESSEGVMFPSSIEPNWPTQPDGYDARMKMRKSIVPSDSL